jgi:2-haloacid dehalogenase
MAQIKNKPALVFDVNETLLDMSPLKDKVNALLNNNQGFRIWFGTLLHYSTVSNNVDQYYNFTELAACTLKMTAHSLEIETSEAAIKDALSVITQLQTYPDVIEGLKLLKDNGFRLITLTNSPDKALQAQLNNSKITEFFEHALSVDSIKKYKPAEETYIWAAQKLELHPSDMMMIAAHGWDMAGATHAGLQTGFIAREGQALYTLSAEPDYQANTIFEMAKILVAEYQ